MDHPITPEYQSPHKLFSKPVILFISLIQANLQNVLTDAPRKRVAYDWFSFLCGGGRDYALVRAQNSQYSFRTWWVAYASLKLFSCSNECVACDSCFFLYHILLARFRRYTPRGGARPARVHSPRVRQPECIPPAFQEEHGTFTSVVLRSYIQLFSLFLIAFL